MYEDLERKMTYYLGAKKLSIEGLSAEDIGKWIKHIRDISLPLTPDLQRIWKNSAGLPLLLDGWIKSSNDLKDYDTKSSVISNVVIPSSKCFVQIF